MPKTIRRAILVVAMAAASLSPPVAVARMAWPASGAVDRWRPLEGVQPGLFDAAGHPCVKQCPDDRLPCDPPSFKTADGRCANQWR